MNDAGLRLAGGPGRALLIAADQDGAGEPASTGDERSAAGCADIVERLAVRTDRGVRAVSPARLLGKKDGTGDTGHAGIEQDDVVFRRASQADRVAFERQRGSAMQAGEDTEFEHGDGLDASYNALALRKMARCCARAVATG